MDLEYITVSGIPSGIKMEQLNLINKHIEELSCKEIGINETVKKMFHGANATHRKIIISDSNIFYFDSYKKSIKYTVRDFDQNLNVHSNFSIQDKNFNYKI